MRHDNASATSLAESAVNDFFRLGIEGAGASSITKMALLTKARLFLTLSLTPLKLVAPSKRSAL